MKHLQRSKSTCPGRPETANFIDVIMTKEVAGIIQRCTGKRIFYGIFPVVGDSMTCDDERSIPDGSGVLVFDLQLDISKPLCDLAPSIPIDEPIIITLVNENSQYGFFCKTISLIDALRNRVRLSSYSRIPEYRSVWVSFHKVRSIYKIVQVIKNIARCS